MANIAQNQMTAQNQRLSGQVVSLPSVNREVFYQTYGRMLFGVLSLKGKNTDVVDIFEGNMQLANTAVRRENIAKGMFGMNAQVRKVSGLAAFGDRDPVATNPLDYGNLEYAINKITSPAVPIRAEMSIKEFETFIEDKDSDLRNALSNWFAMYLDYQMVQTFLRGASVNLLAPRDIGGLDFGFAGRNLSGVGQANRHVWFPAGTPSATNPVNGTDCLVPLDWELSNGSAFDPRFWNANVQSVVNGIDADNSGNFGLTRNRLDSIAVLASDCKFSGANVINATTNHLLIVSPREVLNLRRQIDQAVRIDVGTLLNQLSFYGFQEGFLYSGVLVLGHPVMDYVRPNVNANITDSAFPATGSPFRQTSAATVVGTQTFTEVTYGSGVYVEDYLAGNRLNSTVGVGMVLGRDALFISDNAAIETKYHKNGWDKITACKQSLIFGAVRTEFTQVSLNSSPVDMRDRNAIYNDSSAMILFKASTI